MRKIKHFTGELFLLLCSTIVLSCASNTAKEKNTVAQSEKNIFSAQEKLDTLSEKSKRNHDKLVSLLKIDNLDSGYNGYEIRIWFYYAFSDSGKLVIIQKNAGAWKSKAYFYKIQGDKNYYIVSVNQRKEEASPKSGWDNFSNKMDSFQINNLKSYKEIPGYSLCMGGDGLLFEVAKNNEYKMYHYPCIAVYEDSIKEAKNIMLFLALIEGEFGYELSSFPESKIPTH